ncbi:MAG: deoxyguanosinetriphosphate triphosphohydrolase [Anaerovoracaceae bacterium]|nr:deoxyguanosinetriphosphate triphosphohydrolase [Bacillota bacterium]MDY2671395.1 deoxyguanosinetriphosphate triphosphohydrolase [Anaerovoracaceae bacterium]
MIDRVIQEKREYELLSDMGTKSAESRGRAEAEEPDPVRTEFQRDRDRIIHTKAIRRLMHKTQVFLSPEGDHFSTRLTHTLDVAQISRSISRGLGLNEDLTEAIALGHDLGHTPFGHNGEQYLDERYPDGFRHNEQSLRVVDILEKGHGGRSGLNLTAEVRDGIVNHSGPGIPFTNEGMVVRISDRIAYINDDIEDAVMAGVISEDDLPRDCVKVLGNDHRTRINTLVTDMIVSSEKAGRIVQGEECGFYMNKLRDYMFEHVYRSEVVKQVAEMFKVRHLIFSLYDFYLEHPYEMPEEHIAMLYLYGTDEVVKDYIAGMTDRYAIKMYNHLFVPSGWRLSDNIKQKG